jgi:hypothetical protein
LATSAIIPFLGDEQAVPTQDGVRRHQGADLSEEPAAKDLGFDCQASALIVVEQDASLDELLPEDLVFGAQVVDDLLLLAIDPTGEDEEQKLPGLEDKVHGQLGEGKGRILASGLGGCSSIDLADRAPRPVTERRRSLPYRRFKMRKNEGGRG